MVLKKQNKIIVVDNNQEHLDMLCKPFHQNGIGCLPILYEPYKKLERYSSIRIAFFDINLEDIDVSNQNKIFNYLATALSECIDEKNGPFALIFWTQNAVLIKDFIHYINERKPNIPKPYLINHIDKDQFLENNDNDLGEKLDKLLNSTTLKMLINFEESAEKAASKTIEMLYHAVLENTQWGDTNTFDKSFDLIFSKIAASALGFRHAKENPTKAIYEALSPSILHWLNKESIQSNHWNGCLSSLINSKKNEDLIYPSSFTPSQLNSIFHIDFETPIKTNRGAVCEVKNDNTFFQTYFNISYNDWFSRFVNGLDKTARNASKLIAIEISASCDFSQQKPRTHKYILGLIIEETDFEKLNNDKKPLNLFILDNSYWWNDKSHKICLNLNYVFSDNQNVIVENALFTFKKEIVDMIGNRYANHVSRIGITTF